ncbi:SLC26/SulP family anion transporter [Sporobolomyces salmoneus]|uniref:SLC26/SulP family anion transporter n=1 Tax=Sporobolomyces salmoneus TaxID=183962 RepID=UPI0031825165
MSRYQQSFLNWIGHDPVVSQTASTSRTIKNVARGGTGGVKGYIKSLFPFTNWILNYPSAPQWIIGDLIAGITVGLVVVPQSLSYATIATLPSEFGLYSSFVGVMIYAIFATSKDVTIGPVAGVYLMSLQVSKLIANVQGKEGGADIPGHVIATAMALLAGIIVLAVGLLRLGWLVEFISVPAVAGFMTGSALSICIGQIPSLMGYSNKFDTRAATYKVAINSLKHLPDTKLDAAFGLSGLAFLYFTRWLFNRLERKSQNPIIRRAAFFANCLRIGLTIIVLTAVSYGINKNLDSKTYRVRINKTVPSGFRHMMVPQFDSNLIGLMASEIPVSVIVLLLEHIAISKSFGRINNYKIMPSQELIAVGVTNVVGSFFGAYPATGSFSRSAIKSRAGVRTPLAGCWTGACVVLALYALTGAFYWIPSAGLSAVIIEAVGGLIASPRQTYSYWLVSPLECIIFLAAVIITFFTTIEIGIYFAIAASAALLLVRLAKPRGSFLGRVRVRQEDKDGETTVRDVYVPLRPVTPKDTSVVVEAPPEGVIVFRMEEAFLYVNASHFADQIQDHARETTRNGQDYSLTSQGDRPWNDPGPNRWQQKGNRAEIEKIKAEENERKPLLRAVVFDFSTVSNVDTTSIQNLVDLRRALTRYARQEVEFHFATILSPWIKRALLAGGFGRDIPSSDLPIEIATVVPPNPVHETLTPHRPQQSRTNSYNIDGIDELPNEKTKSEDSSDFDIEKGNDLATVEHRATWQKAASIDGGTFVDTDFPCFHIDLATAVAAAARKRD